MTLLTNYGPYYLSGTVPNLVLSSLAESVKIGIRMDDDMICESRLFFSDDGMCSMRLDSLLSDAITRSMPDMTQLSPTIAPCVSVCVLADDIEIVSFKVCKGAYKGDLVDPSAWMLSHFLTFRPDTEKTTKTAPQFLSYCCVDSDLQAHVLIQCEDGRTLDVKLHDLLPGYEYLINCSFVAINDLVDSQPVAWDVYICKGTAKITRTIRFVLCDVTSTLDVFIVSNSCGGWDTLLFTGSKTLKVSITGQTSTSDGLTRTYDTTTKPVYTKRTGPLKVSYLAYYQDCLASTECYYLDDGAVKLVLLENISAVSSRYVPAVWQFEFRESDNAPAKMIATAEVSDELSIASDLGVQPINKQMSQYKAANGWRWLALPVQYLHDTEWRWMTVDTIVALLESKVDRLSKAQERNKGYFESWAYLRSNYPTPVPGDWALVGTYPPFICVCYNVGVWSQTTQRVNVTCDMTGYVSKDSLTEQMKTINILKGGGA